MIVEHIGLDIEHEELLEDDTALKSSLQACHTLSLIESLIEIVGSLPNFIMNSWIELTHEETFNWEVENCVDQVTEAREGIESQIELS